MQVLAIELVYCVQEYNSFLKFQKQPFECKDDCLKKKLNLSIQVIHVLYGQTVQQFPNSSFATACVYKNDFALSIYTSIFPFISLYLPFSINVHKYNF